jgi:hypothetical protein
MHTEPTPVDMHQMTVRIPKETHRILVDLLPLHGTVSMVTGLLIQRFAQIAAEHELKHPWLADDPYRFMSEVSKLEIKFPDVTQ